MLSLPHFRSHERICVDPEAGKSEICTSQKILKQKSIEESLEIGRKSAGAIK